MIFSTSKNALIDPLTFHRQEILDTWKDRALNSDSNWLILARNSYFEVTEKWMTILYEDFRAIG